MVGHGGCHSCGAHSVIMVEMVERGTKNKKTEMGATDPAHFS